MRPEPSRSQELQRSAAEDTMAKHKTAALTQHMWSLSAETATRFARQGASLPSSGLRSKREIVEGKRYGSRAEDFTASTSERRVIRS
jgi:hypothetical protein